MQPTLTACGVAVLAAGAIAMAQDTTNLQSNRGITAPPGTATTPLPLPERPAPTLRNSAGVPVAIPTGGAGGTLYFSEDSNGNGLYTLDMASGAATNIGISGVTSSTVGLAPAGDRDLLYGSKWSTLLHINSDGSGAVDVGGIGTEGLAFDGSTGTLFGAINGSFFTVNPADGSQSAILAAAPGDVEGIAYGNGGVYGLVGFGGADTDLHFYDPGTDTWSVVGATGIDWSLVGLAFNALEGALYAKGAQDTLLYRINPANGATVVVGDTSLANGGGLAWIPPAPGGPPILWGLSSTSLGRLYTIDASGAATLVTGLNGDASFTGLSFLNDVLYGSDLINFPGASGTYDVGSIDVDTGAVTFVSDQAGSFDWHGLASNEATGQLYSIDIDDDTLPLKVLTPDGTVTTVGAGTGIDGRGMAYDDANGILYATDSNTETLHRIDVNTGVATLIGPLGVPTDFRPGLAYNELTGQLYMNVGGSVNALYGVNKSTGQATLIGPNGVTAIDGLAWRPPACPWDLNGNGFVDFPDLLNVLSNWGPCPGCPADFDGNGFVAFGDLLAVLSNWGRCPGTSPAPCQPPGVCGSFSPCGGTPDCICTTTPDGGGFCVDASTPCGEPCDDGICPDGFICLIDTCCGPTTCVPLDAACSTSPGAPPVLPVGTETISGVVGPDGVIYTPDP